jgi:RNA polymerase sigma-70 factor, ECF subfamily
VTTERSRTPEADPLLVRRAVAGERAAQTQLLEHYHGFIRATLVQLTFGRTQDLEELQQQALIGVARGLSRFAFESSPSTWVRGVCANVVKDHLRRIRRRSRAEQTQQAEHAGDMFDPLGALEARDLLLNVRAALEALSPHQRTAFVLRVLYGHGVDETAHMMKASKAATRARLYFARRAIAAHLREALAMEFLWKGGPGDEVKAS